MQRGRTDGLTIGQAARRSGLPASTIRFYEAQGIVTPGARTEAGYRLFTDADIRRLVLARQARSLGLALPQVTALVAGASSADCGEFAQEFRAQIAARRASVAGAHRRTPRAGDDADSPPGPHRQLRLPARDGGRGLCLVSGTRRGRR